MTVFATSDWHLGHTNIQKHEPTRPDDLEDRLWLELKKVQPGDNFYFLGDFCFYKRLEEKRAVERLADSLPGVLIFWVLGNHDSMSAGFLKKYGIVAYKRFFNSLGVLYSHYPPTRPGHVGKRSATQEAVVAEWETGHNKFCVHGHTHSKRPARWGDTFEFINVCPEVNDFSIVNLTKLLGLE